MLITSSQKLIVFFATVLYIIVAFNSNGYHQEDEHYQIIGFAEYRVNKTQDVSWEYKKKLRSSLQASLCIVIFDCLRAFNINDPFVLTLILRLLSATISILIISSFTAACSHFVEKKFWVFFLLLSYFLWFIPYIAVRFSSENWGGLFCLLSLTFLLNGIKYNIRNKFILSGLMLGIAIQFRFHEIFVAFGMICWCLFIGKIKVSRLLYFITSLLVVLILGCLLDSWFYREPTFALYNYFEINAVKGVASYFGTFPWYYILLYLLKCPTYPIGITVLLSIVVILKFEPTNIFTWCTIPFLVIHTITAHKEVRFLFPLVNFVPVILVLSLQHTQFLISYINRALRLSVFLIISSINMIGILVIAYKSPRKGDVEIAMYIYRHFDGRQINILASNEANPFDPKLKFNNSFYTPQNVRLSEITSIWASDFKKNIKANSVNYLVLKHSEFTGVQAANFLNKIGFILVKDTLPNPLKYFVKLYDACIDNIDITKGIVNEDQLLLYQYVN